MRGACCIILLAAACTGAIAAVQADDPVRSAGCYIASEHGVVMTIGRFGGKLQLPAGSRQRGESPRCAARRETLEETGLVVRVGEPVGTHTRGRFVLFHCVPEKQLTRDTRFEPLDVLEVREVLILDPITLLSAGGVRVERPWRFVEDRDLLIALYRRGANAFAPAAAALDCDGETQGPP